MVNCHRLSPNANVRSARSPAHQCALERLSSQELVHFNDVVVVGCFLLPLTGLCLATIATSSSTAYKALSNSVDPSRRRVCFEAYLLSTAPFPTDWHETRVNAPLAIYPSSSQQQLQTKTKNERRGSHARPRLPKEWPSGGA